MAIEICVIANRTPEITADANVKLRELEEDLAKTPPNGDEPISTCILVAIYGGMVVAAGGEPGALLSKFIWSLVPEQLSKAAEVATAYITTGRPEVASAFTVGGAWIAQQHQTGKCPCEKKHGGERPTSEAPAKLDPSMN